MAKGWAGQQTARMCISLLPAGTSKLQSVGTCMQFSIALPIRHKVIDVQWYRTFWA